MGMSLPSGAMALLPLLAAGAGGTAPKQPKSGQQKAELPTPTSDDFAQRLADISRLIGQLIAEFPDRLAEVQQRLATIPDAPKPNQS